MTSRVKLSTAERASRRQAATRLLRLREEAGSQEQASNRFGISKRTLGGLERAEHRMTALEAFLTILDHVIATKGLDAALSAILTEEQRHAASWENPRGLEYRSSHQINLSDSGAHGGQYAAVNDSVVGGGAETSALMPNTQERGPRAIERWRSDPSNTVAQPGSALGITPEVARSNRVGVPYPTQLSKRVVSAQEVESAGRPASEDLSASGSAAGELGGHAEQPTSISTRRRAA